jgi:hypothetical protein
VVDSCEEKMTVVVVVVVVVSTPEFDPVSCLESMHLSDRR